MLDVILKHLETPDETAMDESTVSTMRTGDLVTMPPGRDPWVVDAASYVSLHFEGAEAYASKK